MSVRPIDMIMVPQMNQVSNVKHTENHRPVVEQMTIATNSQKDAKEQISQVKSKDDVDNKNKKFDAKDKSDNEYEGNGNSRKKKTISDGTVRLKEVNNRGFDMKV